MRELFVKNKSVISVLVLVLSIMTSFTSSETFAQRDGEKVTSILYVCGMTFKVSGRSASLVFGYTNLKGQGQLSCYDILTGETEIIPTTVTLRGPAVGISYQTVEISAKVAGIGIRRNPESLLGRYLTVRESAAVGVGVGVSKSLRVAKDAVVIDLSVQGIKGIGAQIDILSLDIQKRDDLNESVSTAPNTLQDSSQYDSQNESNHVSVAPMRAVRVRENQPIQIIGENGQILKVITLKVSRSNPRY